MLEIGVFEIKGIIGDLIDGLLIKLHEAVNFMFVKILAYMSKDDNKFKEDIFVDDLAVFDINQEFNNRVKIIDELRLDSVGILENKPEYEVFI